MKDDTIKSKFIELRAKNWSYNRIADELKVSKQTLITWSKDLSHVISNLRAMEIEELQERYFCGAPKANRTFWRSSKENPIGIGTARFRRGFNGQIIHLIAKVCRRAKDRIIGNRILIGGGQHRRGTLGRFQTHLNMAGLTKIRPLFDRGPMSAANLVTKQEIWTSIGTVRI